MREKQEKKNIRKNQQPLGHPREAAGKVVKSARFTSNPGSLRQAPVGAAQPDAGLPPLRGEMLKKCNFCCSGERKVTKTMCDRRPGAGKVQKMKKNAFYGPLGREKLKNGRLGGCSGGSPAAARGLRKE